MITHDILKQRQSLPLEVKVQMSLNRIREFYEFFDGQVYVAFSGGKDSTVLLHLVRTLYPKVPAVFNNTGVEFPEIYRFVKTTDNVIWIKPKKSFKQIIQQHGYPIISKEIAQKIYELRNYNLSEKLKNNHLQKLGKWRCLLDAPFKISHLCCKYLKKDIAKHYEKETGRKPFIGLLAEDSQLRTENYLKYSCNAYNLKRPRSIPLAFWTTRDVWEYIRENNIPYSNIYDMGYKGTGCIYCGFGTHLAKENKFLLLKQTHPKLYDYAMNNLGLKEIYDWLKINVDLIQLKLEL